LIARPVLLTTNCPVLPTTPSGFANYNCPVLIAPRQEGSREWN
jgi:hypothetical protein